MCFNNDKNTSIQISIYFNAEGTAQNVKYKGQTKWIDLIFVKTTEENQGGAYPVISDLYSEIYNGKKSGTYKITKSGIWYYVEYRRKKDNKKFNFTKKEETLNKRLTKPCF